MPVTERRDSFRQRHAGHVREIHRHLPEASWRECKRLGRQQVSRPPVWRPGDVVRLKEFADGHPLSGAVRVVRSVTAAFTAPDQFAATWRVHFEPDGLSVVAGLVERFATEGEAARVTFRRRAA